MINAMANALFAIATSDRQLWSGFVMSAPLAIIKINVSYAVVK